MPCPPRSLRLLPWLGAGLLLALALPAAASKVYQWKDAQGVTHYSDSPPPDAAYRNRAIRNPAEPAPQAAAKPVVNANCSNARSNLQVLQSGSPVGVDEDRDGKPERTLTESERANRVALAEAQIKTYCEAPAVAGSGG
ncbi:DUF4124 domain-containing protein [Vulcaniibacterium tengchongense]|uniref:Uncharacterized protein DUF4124 n=1 Tax=Vulcaniibacterium tengchongense TaxID=1273429 RepID=A0A3N4VR99_9GAMM|nr:DUF4124 domain-containing protein [Vulcaniibacterium tengchongense]RPE79577.1 uncharacterized protein DUF4124 [Vulcaniibacterium tengchongense]